LKVELRINQTKTGQHLSLINVNFDQENVVTCTKTEPKNDLFFNCRTKTKELLKKELSNVAPASRITATNMGGKKRKCSEHCRIQR
jgi:hypothetical protein